MRNCTLRWPSIGGIIAAAGVYAWWATSLRPFTDPSLVAVPAGGLLVMAVGAALLPPRAPVQAPLRPRAPLRTPLRCGSIWAGLFGALAGWQLATFLQHPRAEHPTISSLANTLFEHHPARALAMLLWLVGAAALARR